MKIPRSIKVGGHTYQVEFMDGLWMREGNLGQCRHHTDQTIELDSALHPDQTAATFLHEMLHIVDRVYNKGSLGEDEVDAIAEGLYQAFSEMGITFER